MNENRKAFLDMVAYSEGTPRYGDQDGYNVIVGGGTFADYSDHPRVKIWLSKLGIYSTAAGRYQLLARFFDAYKKQLGLADFSPASQDAIALQQIKECKALSDIDAGNIEDAIKKCSRIWASLPGAGYGQHENKLTALVEQYRQYGGL